MDENSTSTVCRAADKCISCRLTLAQMESRQPYKSRIAPSSLSEMSSSRTNARSQLLPPGSIAGTISKPSGIASRFRTVTLFATYLTMEQNRPERMPRSSRQPLPLHELPMGRQDLTNSLRRCRQEQLPPGRLPIPIFPPPSAQVRDHLPLMETHDPRLRSVTAKAEPRLSLGLRHRWTPMMKICRPLRFSEKERVCNHFLVFHPDTMISS
jgi:hypothetical protein